MPSLTTPAVFTALLAVATAWNTNPPPAPNCVALGCYTDYRATGRTLLHDGEILGGPDAVTVDKCTASCWEAGFALAGVEYGGECYCDNALQNGGGPAPDGDAQCNMPCKGNPDQICGGPDRINVYHCGGDETTTTTTSAEVITTTSEVPTTVYSTSSEVPTTSSEAPYTTTTEAPHTTTTEAPYTSTTEEPYPEPTEEPYPEPTEEPYPEPTEEPYPTESTKDNSPVPTTSEHPVYPPPVETTSKAVYTTTTAAPLYPFPNATHPSGPTGVYPPPVESKSSNLPIYSSTPPAETYPIESKTTSAPIKYTTSTAYTTLYSTVTACPPEVKNCPYGSVTTVTIPVYTTVCPVKDHSKPVVTKPATKPIKPTKPMTTSTVYTTNVITISACPPEVTDCPYVNKPVVVTKTDVLYTTVCPVADEYPTPTPPPYVPEVPTTDDGKVTTSSVTTTIYLTVTKCAPGTPNCPEESKSIYTVPVTKTNVVTNTNYVTKTIVTKSKPVEPITKTVIPVPPTTTPACNGKYCPATTTPPAPTKSYVPGSAAKVGGSIGAAAVAGFVAMML